MEQLFTFNVPRLMKGGGERRADETCPPGEAERRQDSHQTSATSPRRGDKVSPGAFGQHEEGLL